MRISQVVANSVGLLLHLRRRVTPLPMVELQRAAHLKLSLERVCSEVWKDSHLPPFCAPCAHGKGQLWSMWRTTGGSFPPFPWQAFGVAAVACSCFFEKTKNYLHGSGISWEIAGDVLESEKLCSSQTGGGDRNRTDGRGRQKGSGKQCTYISDQKWQTALRLFKMHKPFPAKLLADWGLCSLISEEWGC